MFHKRIPSHLRFGGAGIPHHEHVELATRSPVCSAHLETDRQGDREIERQNHKERERDRDGERQKEKDRESERQIQREIQRERVFEREITMREKRALRESYEKSL